MGPEAKKKEERAVDAIELRCASFLKRDAFCLRFSVTLSIVSMVALLSVSLWAMHTVERARRTVYLIDPASGDFRVAGISDITPQVRRMEALGHARDFTELFFSLDRRCWRERISRAYSMGTSCIHDLYSSLEKEDWFRRMEEYNISQRVRILSVRDLTPQALEGEYRAEVVFELEVLSDLSSRSRWRVTLVLEMRDAQQRTLDNIHALDITFITLKKSEIK